jgi:hypothetical protein
MSNSSDDNRNTVRWDEPARRTGKDIERVRQAARLSDDEITRRAMDDPDNPPLSDDELAQMRLVEPGSLLTAQDLLRQLAVADDATVLDVVAGAASMLAERRRHKAATRQAG